MKTSLIYRFLFICYLLVVFLNTTTSQDTNQPASIIVDQSGSVHPWSHLEFNNDPDNFQFAIVTDRTGGHRPGVFMDAVNKLNLLQPEFVVSVGDLIEGYTRDEERIYRQWDEFNGFIGQLQMPFFYVPGNHDYINDVMARIWEEKFGPSYYNFVYRDVLFLCLNSEEATKGASMGGIEKPQYEYVKKVLEENPEVKWTLIFMHQPLWILDNTRYWKDIEQLLEDREHTVFAGHKHHYVKYTRNNSKYIMLATTGGTSQLRGPNFGEFDHVVWVTMTKEGPVIANLLLEGIWHENIVTEELNEMIGAQRINIEPVFEENYFREGDFQIKITNDANYPMWTVLRFGTSKHLNPQIVEYQKSIPPNSVEQVTVNLSLRKNVRMRDIAPIPLYAWFAYQYEDGREIKLDDRYGLAPIKKEMFDRPENEVVLDGKLDDWSGLPFRGNYKSVITDDVGEYAGDYDAHYEFNIMYDDEYLYMGMAVWDDELVQKKDGSFWDQDAVLIHLDARSSHASANGRGANRFMDYFHLNFTPSTSRRDTPDIYQEERLPEGTRIVTSKSVQGFDMELAIPISYIHNMGGENWKSIRLNVCYFDVDENSSRTGIWWYPEWSSKDNFIGSGMLFKTLSD
jgi:3',5'-cyclic AMP phosphodiesterase CpdA